MDVWKEENIDDAAMDKPWSFITQGESQDLMPITYQKGAKIKGQQTSGTGERSSVYDAAASTNG